MEFLRTPEDRFTTLPDFPYAPHYLEDLEGYPGMRLHYVDQGPRDAPVFLCLHGEPTWAFLYRKMAPVFLEAGARVVAPDFFGFGRSDKPTDDATYTWSFHRQTLVQLIERLDLRQVTLVCQDWGGILGLTLPPEMPERFARLLVMNTALATGEQAPSDGFLAWKQFVAAQPDLNVAELMRRAVPGIDAAACSAYDAPFPDQRYKAGVRRFPAIVPVKPDMEGAEQACQAASWWRESWDGPTFMAVGAHDPVLGLPVMNELRQVIRNCPEPLVLDDAGHFAQERGDRIARAALAAWA